MKDRPVAIRCIIKDVAHPLHRNHCLVFARMPGASARPLVFWLFPDNCHAFTEYRIALKYLVNKEAKIAYWTSPDGELILAELDA